MKKSFNSNDIYFNDVCTGCRSMTAVNAVMRSINETFDVCIENKDLCGHLNLDLGERNHNYGRKIIFCEHREEITPENSNNIYILLEHAKHNGDFNEYFFSPDEKLLKKVDYYAQSIPLGSFSDMYKKISKAEKKSGCSLISVLCLCADECGYSVENSLNIMHLAVECCLWPLYETENGKLKMTYIPNKKIPVEIYLKSQKRFDYIFSGSDKLKIINTLQKRTDERWSKMLLQ